MHSVSTGRWRASHHEETLSQTKTTAQAVDVATLGAEIDVLHERMTAAFRKANEADQEGADVERQLTAKLVYAKS